MKVPMRIDVVERQPGGVKNLELRGDFPRRLPPQGSVQGKLRAVAGKVVAQSAVAIDETGYVRALGHRLAIDEDKVKPDTQVRQPSRALHRVGRGWSADHETCGAENTLSMRRLDGFVDGLAEPEIIRIYDQAVQCASSRRSRRKAKNSKPSRNRRSIMSGLRTISETIVAILGARK